jgi:hypothetical protein
VGGAGHGELEGGAWAALRRRVGGPRERVNGTWSEANPRGRDEGRFGSAVG